MYPNFKLSSAVLILAIPPTGRFIDALPLASSKKGCAFNLCAVVVAKQRVRLKIEKSLDDLIAS